MNLRGKEKTLLWLVVILGAVALTLWSSYRFLAPPHGAYRVAYQGRIIDKWATYSESEQGSTPQFRLLIKGDDQSRFTVSVSPEIYEQATVGMRIRKDSNNGVVLTVTED